MSCAVVCRAVSTRLAAKNLELTLAEVTFANRDGTGHGQLPPLPAAGVVRKQLSRRDAVVDLAIAIMTCASCRRPCGTAHFWAVPRRSRGVGKSGNLDRRRCVTLKAWRPRRISKIAACDRLRVYPRHNQLAVPGPGDATTDSARPQDAEATRFCNAA